MLIGQGKDQEKANMCSWRISGDNGLVQHLSGHLGLDQHLTKDTLQRAAVSAVSVVGKFDNVQTNQ